MKVRYTLVIFFFLGLLAACQTPQSPPEATPTDTPEPSSTPTVVPITFTPTASFTSRPTITIEPSHTPLRLVTPTVSTAQSAPTSLYPVGPQTPLPDAGFVEITTQNVAQLTPVFSILRRDIWQSAASRDGKQLFVAANDGIFVYNRQGQQIAHWPSVLLHSQPCQSCLSVNTDGSRFAVTTHRNGQWFAQVYNVYENEANLLLEKPIGASVTGVVNEVRVALSPDGLLLAYGAGDGDTLVIDMNDGQVLLTNPGGGDSAVFSPDGAYFIIRRGKLLFFWKVADWGPPATLQLLEENSAYAFSPDGKRLGIASTDKIRAYALDTLALNREISIPTPAGLKRNWEITFLDEKTLAGYNLLWDSTHTEATIDVAQWDLDTGETLQMASHKTDSPDILSALWGATIPFSSSVSGPVALDHYSVFRFVDDERLLVNSQHSACWLTLSSGETQCFNDPTYRVLSSQDAAYREIPQRQTTILQDWNRKEVYALAVPYPYLLLNSTADYYVVNAKDSTTDVYFKGKAFGIEALPGTLMSYDENAGFIVINARQRQGGGMMSMIDKSWLKVVYQKTDDFMLKPLAFGKNNKVYFTRRDVGLGQVVLKVVDGRTYAVSDLAYLTLPAEPQVMSISSNGIFAFGLQDGSVSIVSADGLQVASFQAAYTRIDGISLTPDGRYLAVASDDGIWVFAVMP